MTSVDGPGGFDLLAYLSASSLAEAYDRVKPTLVGPFLRSLRPRKVPAAARYLSREMGNDSLVVFPAQGRPGYALRIALLEGARSFDELGAALEALAEVAGALADTGAATHVEITRLRGGNLSPVPPLGVNRAHLLSASDADIASCYLDPQVFRSSWSQVEVRGGLTLYLRAFYAIANVDFLAVTLHHQLRLARAARPGTVRYFAPSLTAAEEAFLEESPRKLTGVGYHPDTRTYEFAGFLPEGEDLDPRDLFEAWDLASRQRVVDVRGNELPVDRVHAVFPDRRSAEWARVLLDPIGVVVLYPDDSGADVPV
jgi:hypothetical protein